MATQLTGRDNDTFMAWLVTNTTATPDNLVDYQHAFLDEESVAAGALNDRWSDWLEQAPQSFTGSLSDKWYSYIGKV